jgi:hypothetical protein
MLVTLTNDSNQLDSNCLFVSPLTVHTNQGEDESKVKDQISKFILFGVFLSLLTMNRPNSAPSGLPYCRPDCSCCPASCLEPRDLLKSCPLAVLPR